MEIMMKKFFTAFILFTLLSIAQPTNPKLIVFLSIDQMRADYFTRYGKYFTGGFDRLYRTGITYANADLNFSASETGPGHAALGTGTFPWKNGIVGNEWFDRTNNKEMYCVADSTSKPVDGIGGGFSPNNLVVTAVGDWLKQHSPKSKVIAASTKDRAAILMGGKKADYAFWHNKNIDGMVTSGYYARSLPQWVKDFNASGWSEKNVPPAWTKSLPEAEYAKIGPDTFDAEAKWKEKTSFPHEFTFGKKKEQINGSPYGDKLVVDFAMEAVKHERLGQRNVTDLLCISLSNCDYVGHAQGPDSHEMFDLLVKIDRYLGDLFAYLDTAVGKDRYVIALSADHGVCPLPEFNAQYNGVDARRFIYANDIKPKLDSLSAALKKELNTTDDVIYRNAFINYAAGATAGVDSVRLEEWVKSALLSIDAYADVYFRREMVTRAPSNRPFIEKYRNTYYAPRGKDYIFRIKENSIVSSRTYGSTHGSPYAYDTHVPVLFWWNGIVPKTITREIYSADIAPTLAKIAGFPYPQGIDGAPLKEIVK
jgi:predicted AlkP superfamily pyrophosphatase or phosphodiesterase